MYSNFNGSFYNSFASAPLFVPIVNFNNSDFTHLPEEIKQKIEENRSKFNTEEELNNFIRMELLKS